jgi:uncharacterized protein (DUF58 family)
MKHEGRLRTHLLLLRLLLMVFSVLSAAGLLRVGLARGFGRSEGGKVEKTVSLVESGEGDVVLVDGLEVH